MKKLISLVVAAGGLIGTSPLALGADEAAITLPAGSAMLLELGAAGAQIYTCEAKEGRFEWSFKAPEANLFDNQGRQAGTHFAGPTWKMVDGSAVVGEVIAKADSPEPGAIPWLLLRAKSHGGGVGLSGRRHLRPSNRDQRWGSAENRLRRGSSLRTGAHTLLRDLPVLQGGIVVALLIKPPVLQANRLHGC
jgi:hypothetical protein